MPKPKQAPLFFGNIRRWATVRFPIFTTVASSDTDSLGWNVEREW
jgi:hypothetical protein